MLTLKEERRSEILRQLTVSPYASVTELAGRVGYSVATIKRDLSELEKQGLVRRTHGGATLINQDRIDIPYLMKMSKTNDDRNKGSIAAAAQHLIHDDMTLFIDSSTTCLHLIKHLTRYKGLHIITNGVATAALLSERTNAEVCILGGVVSTHHQTVNGAKAYNDMLSYNADLAILSCRGFSINSGASEIDEGEALLKQAVRRQATEVALLVVEEKFGAQFVYQSLRCADIDCLITDARLCKESVSELEACNIDVMNCG